MGVHGAFAVGPTDSWDWYALARHAIHEAKSVDEDPRAGTVPRRLIAPDGAARIFSISVLLTEASELLWARATDASPGYLRWIGERLAHYHPEAGAAFLDALGNTEAADPGKPLRAYGDTLRALADASPEQAAVQAGLAAGYVELRHSEAPNHHWFEAVRPGDVAGVRRTLADPGSGVPELFQAIGSLLAHRDDADLPAGDRKKLAGLYARATLGLGRYNAVAAGVLARARTGLWREGSTVSSSELLHDVASILREPAAAVSTPVTEPHQSTGSSRLRTSGGKPRAAAAAPAGR